MTPVFTILEIEYCGSRYRNNHVIEVAMVKIDEQGNRTNLHKVINPGEDLPDFIWALVTFNRQAMEQAPLFADAAAQIAQFCNNTVLAGVNIRYTYSLLRRAFKQAGHRFVHKHICMSKLLAEAYAQLNIKTTGELCQKLGIAFHTQFTLLQRAQCMADLFEHLFIRRMGSKNTAKSLVHQTALYAKLPPNLPFSKVQNLPSAMGVYYFYDHKGKIVYLGKSNDIKKRALTHFNSDLNEFKKWEMKNAIYDVQYRLTGSELVALLLESDEIKRYMPAYNRAQKRVKYTQGIYLSPQPNGYLHFTIATLGSEEGMLFMKFSNKWRAIKFILYAALQYGLNLQYCGLSAYQQAETEAANPDAANPNANPPPEEPLTETPEQHNQKALNLIAHYSYPEPNLIIVDKGRTPDELAAILIQNNVYQGYAYLPHTTNLNPITLPQEVQNYLIPMRDNPDVQSIIRNYLNKHSHNLTIVPFNPAT